MSKEESSPTSGKQLGVVSLAALVVANMVGAGVFASSGYSLAMLGNPHRVMLSWALCGVWAICGALSYGALIRRLPQSGGEYLFLSKLVHPSIGFLAGWTSLVAGFTAPIAIAAKNAIAYGLPDLDPMTASLAASLLIAAVALTLWYGISLSASTQTVIVCLKLALIAILILWAFFFTSSDAWAGGPLPDRAPNMIPTGLDAWITLVASMTWIALSYTGFNAAIYVAGEAKQARQTVPLAMLLATLAITVVYLLLNYIFVFAPAPELIAGEGNVADIAASAIGGKLLSGLVRSIVTVAMISSVFSLLIAGPRVYQQMAIDGAMPRILQGKSGSPRLAIVLQATLAIATVFAAKLLQVMQFLGLTLSVSGAIAVGSLFWMSRRIDCQRLRIWEVIPACIYLLFTTALVAAGFLEQRTQFFAMLATFALGIVAYFASMALGIGRTEANRPDNTN